MFGSTFGQSKPAGTGLFSNTATVPQTQFGGGSLFGGAQAGQQQQAQQAQPAGNSLFGAGNQNAQQQPATTSLFGNASVQPVQQPASTGVFAQPQAQSQPPQGASMFGQMQQAQPQQSQLSTSVWNPAHTLTPREKDVPAQIAAVRNKWDTSHPDCDFNHWFYNQVGEEYAIYYTPTPGEDPKAWEDALSKKPGPGYVPVLCSGFSQLGERIAHQQRTLAVFNGRLHEIKESLTHMLRMHDTKTSVRTTEAKRKHAVLKQRCLTLATKVQVLRNRGYALGGSEEELKMRLQALEKEIFDPGLNSQAEEIWARMNTVQERVDFLKLEFARMPADSLQSIDDETARKAKKLLEDYQTQMAHLKKEVEAIHKDFGEWEQENGGTMRTSTSHRK